MRFERELTDPHFNIVWVNEHRQNVFAISTAADPAGTGHFAAGETVTLTAAFVASLAPGRYQPSLVVSRPGLGQDIVEHWAQMFSLLIASPRAVSPG